jgi:predicted RNA binding protein YcfA (HicA-like mRNA interferase family)
MKKLSPMSANELVKVVRKLGFDFFRQRGSHMIFKHLDGRVTVIPNHPGEDLGVGLLNKIIKKDLHISREKFEEFL